MLIHQLGGFPENHAARMKNHMSQRFHMAFVSIHIIAEMTKLRTWRLAAGGRREWGRRVWTQPSKWDTGACDETVPGTKVTVRK